MVSAAPMTEREFQDAVVDMAKLLGWHVHHTRPARTEKGWRTPIQGHAGFPDLVLMRPPDLMFVELKVRPNKLTKAQREWVGGLNRSSAHCYVLDERDWPENIEALLR